MAFNLTATINAQLNQASVVSSIQDLQSRLRANSNKIAVPVKITVSGTKADQINKINTAFIALNKTLPTTNAEVNKVAAAFVNLKAAMSGVNSVNQQLTATNVNIANSSKQVTKQITQAKDAVFEFGRISGLAFRRAAGYTIAATALYGTGRAIASSLKEAVEFQNEMVKISQITGQSVVSLKSLRDEVFKLATTWGVSSKEILNTAQILAQAGLSAKDTQLALEALTKTSLSATFGNMEETADGAIAAIAQFKIGAKDLEKALGAVGAVSAAFAVESEDIIAAIKRTGGVFASLSGNSGVGAGIKSLNEFVAIFSSVRATTRESAESIATGLRTIFTRIQRPATISLLRNFGVELQDAEGKFVGLYKATELLSEGLKKLDTRDPRFAKIVEELGGFRQIGKVIPLLTAYEERQKALQIAQQGGNQLTKDAEKAQESFLVQLTKVREEFNKLINDVSETSTFKTFISVMLTAARTAISVADALKPLIPILGALGGIKLLSLLPRVSRGSFKGVTTLQARHGGYVPELAGGGMPRKRSGHIKDGSVNEDNILAFIGRDEYVLPSETVKRVGVGYLDALRRNEVPGFADGTDGGTKLPKGLRRATTSKDVNSGIAVNLKKKLEQSLDVSWSKPLSAVAEKTSRQFGKIEEKAGSFEKAISDAVHTIQQNKRKIASVGQLNQYANRGGSNIDEGLKAGLPEDTRIVRRNKNGTVSASSGGRIYNAPASSILETDRNQNIANLMDQPSRRGFYQEDLGYQAGFQNDEQKARLAALRNKQGISNTGKQLDLGYQPGFQNDEQKARLAEIKRRQQEIIDQRNAQKASLQQQRDAVEQAKQQRIKGRTFNDAFNSEILNNRRGPGSSYRRVDFRDRTSLFDATNARAEYEDYTPQKRRQDRRQYESFMKRSRVGKLTEGDINFARGLGGQVTSDGLPYGPQNQSRLRRRIGSLGSRAKGGIGKLATGKLSTNTKLGIGFAAGYAGDQVQQAVGGKAGAGLGAGVQGAGLGAAAGLNPVLIAAVASFSAASAYLAKESEDALNSASDRLAKGFDGLNKALESKNSKDIAKNFDIALSAVNNQVAAQGFAEKNTLTNRAASLFSGTEEIRDPTELDQARTAKSRGKASTSGFLGTDRTATGYADLAVGAFTLGTVGAGSQRTTERDSDLFSADYGYRRGKKEADDNLEAGVQLKNSFAEQAPALQDRLTSLLVKGKDINDLTFNPLDKNKKSAFSQGETVALASAIADQSELKALGSARNDPSQQATIARNIIGDNQNELKKIAEIQKATKEAAESYREAAVETERFTDKLDKLKAGFERAGTVGDSFRKANDSVTTGFFSQQDNRNVFGNTKAFGTSEIAAEAQKIRASIGRTTTQTVSEQARDKSGNLIPNKFVERTTTGNTADSFTNAIVGVKQLQEGLPSVVDGLNAQLKNIDSEDPEIIKGTQKDIIKGQINKFTNLPASLRDQVSGSLLAEVDKRGKEGNLDNVDINQILDPIADSVNQAAKAFIDANNRNIGEYEASIKEWVSLQQKANASRNNSVQLAITNQNKLSTLKGNDLSVSEQDAGYRQQLKNFSQISGTPISQDSLRPQGPARGPIALQQTLGSIDARRSALMASSQSGGDQGEIARQLGELKIQEDAAISALQLMATNTDTLVALENENLKLQRAADAERNAISGKASGSLSEQLKTIQDVTFTEQALADPNRAAAIGAMGGEQRQRLDRGLQFLKETNSEDKDFIKQLEGVEATANSNSLIGTFVRSRRNLSVDEMTDRQAKRGAPYEKIQEAYKRRTDEMEIADQTLANRDQSKANEYGRNARGRYEAEKAAIENPETMIQSFITNLSTVAAQLEKVNIPEKIEFGGTTKVEVLISGAEQMSAMQGELSKLIESKVQGELRRYINQDGSMKQNPSVGGK